jgi:hypothetical protein
VARSRRSRSVPENSNCQGRGESTGGWVNRTARSTASGCEPRLLRHSRADHRPRCARGAEHTPSAARLSRRDPWRCGPASGPVRRSREVYEGAVRKGPLAAVAVLNKQGAPGAARTIRGSQRRSGRKDDPEALHVPRLYQVCSGPITSIPRALSQGLRGDWSDLVANVRHLWRPVWDSHVPRLISPLLWRLRMGRPDVGDAAFPQPGGV